MISIATVLESLISKIIESTLIDRMTETDGNSIPTGKLVNVGGTPYDLRTATKLGDVMAKGDTLFDDNFCVTTHENKVGKKIEI